MAFTASPPQLLASNPALSPFSTLFRRPELPVSENSSNSKTLGRGRSPDFFLRGTQRHSFIILREGEGAGRRHTSIMETAMHKGSQTRECTRGIDGE